MLRSSRDSPPKRLASFNYPLVAPNNRTALTVAEQSELELLLIATCGYMRSQDEYVRLFLLVGGESLPDLLIGFLDYSFHCLVTDQQNPPQSRAFDKRHIGGRNAMPPERLPRVSADIIRRALECLRALHCVERTLVADPLEAANNSNEEESASRVSPHKRHQS